MSDFDELMAQIEAEAEAEGPQAVAQLRAFDELFARMVVTGGDGGWVARLPEPNLIGGGPDRDAAVRDLVDVTLSYVDVRRSR